MEDGSLYEAYDACIYLDVLLTWRLRRGLHLVATPLRGLGALVRRTYCSPNSD